MASFHIHSARGLRAGLAPALSAVLLTLFAPPSPPKAAEPVSQVVDGDTIRIGEERIRLMGFDTPETRCRCREECLLAAEATALLARILGSGEVEIDRRRKDRYGRTLAVVTVDGRDVAETMIDTGLAYPYEGGRRRSWC